jgi:MFS family permease
MYGFVNGVAGLYVGWLPDFYGRKTTILAAGGAALLIQLVFMLTRSPVVRYLCIFLFAITNVKNGCCYVLALEMTDAGHKAFVTTTMNVFERATLLMIAIFLIFFGRWWQVIAWTYWSVGVLALAVVYFKVPESPLWFVMNNRNTEAIDILNQIAITNHSSSLIDYNVEFTEMQLTENEEDDQSVAQTYHTYISTVAGGMNAASFAIQSSASYEQKSLYTYNKSLPKRRDTALKLEQQLQANRAKLGKDEK